MTIFSKIWLFLLILVTIPFFYLSARTLKTHQMWRTLHDQANTLLENKLAQIEALKRGEREVAERRAGIMQLKTQLDGWLKLRGRAWRNARPGQIDPASGAVIVNLEDNPNHNIQPGLVLYVFEQVSPLEGGNYIGDFKVLQVAETQVSLQPAQNYGPPQAQLKQKLVARMQEGAQRPDARWALYDNMPIDSPQVFRDVPDEELREMLPNTVIDMYLRDGTEPQPNDPEDRIVDVKNDEGDVIGQEYQRPLRDFQQIILDLDTKLFSVTDEIAGREEDIKRLDRSIAGAQADVEFRMQELTQLQKDLAEAKREVAAVEAEQDSVRQELARLRSEVETVYKQNKQLAEQVAKNQEELLKRATGQRVAGR